MWWQLLLCEHLCCDGNCCVNIFCAVISSVVVWTSLVLWWQLLSCEHLLYFDFLTHLTCSSCYTLNTKSKNLADSEWHHSGSVYTQTLCFTYLCLRTDALTITPTCWLYIINTYVYYKENNKSVYLYKNINVTNISNMHHIAGTTIKIYLNFIKLVRSCLIYCNMIFEWNYIAYKWKIIISIRWTN